MRIHSVHPDCLLKFFVYKGDDTYFASRKNVSQNQISDTNIVVVRNDIISVETTKGKGSIGAFGIMLSSNRNWSSIISPGSWVMIYMSNERIDEKRVNEVESGLKMIGIVRSVRMIENLDPSTGTKTVRYLISGQDFQSVFHTPIYLNQLFGNSGSSGEFNFIGITGERAAGKAPHETMRVLATALLGSFQTVNPKTGKLKTNVGFSRGFQPFIVPPKLKMQVLGEQRSATNLFMDMVTFFLQENLIGKLTNINIPTGTVETWSILKSYSHSLLNELYTELLPVKTNGKIRLVPSLVFRAIPFSSEFAQKKVHASAITMSDANDVLLGDEKFVPLRTGNVARNTVVITKKKKISKLINSAHFFTSKVITEDEITGFSVGRTDDERFNMFVVFPNNSVVTSLINPEQEFFKSVTSGGVDYLDKVSTGRYGSRPFIADSQYILFSLHDQTALNRIVRDLWFRAHLFENGQVQIIGSPSYIPVGTNVEFFDRIDAKRIPSIAHVEKVDNQFSVQPGGVKNFSTTISFVRLQKKIPQVKTINGVKYRFPDPINSTDMNNLDGQKFDEDRSVNQTVDERDQKFITPAGGLVVSAKGGFPPGNSGGLA